MRLKRSTAFGSLTTPKGVPKLPRPADAPVRNRMWTPAEFEVVWHHASAPLRRALALASFAGMRVGDVVMVTWSSWDGHALSWRQSKTGHPVHVQVPDILREELRGAPRRSPQILTNHDGKPYVHAGRPAKRAVAAYKPSRVPWSHRTRPLLPRAAPFAWGDAFMTSASIGRPGRQPWAIRAMQLAPCTSGMAIGVLRLIELFWPHSATLALCETASELTENCCFPLLENSGGKLVCPRTSISC
ncbi:hypothetical protein BH11PSE3_BH11PSE3_00630 [soil metagenome]